MNIQKMMQQAQQMQERLQKQMAEMKVEGAAGGGMVGVVVNGHKQVLSVTLDPEVVSKDDVQMLQDLIVAAIADAHGGSASVENSSPCSEPAMLVWSLVWSRPLDSMPGSPWRANSAGACGTGERRP